MIDRIIDYALKHRLLTILLVVLVSIFGFVYGGKATGLYSSTRGGGCHSCGHRATCGTRVDTMEEEDTPEVIDIPVDDIDPDDDNDEEL